MCVCVWLVPTISHLHNPTEGSQHRPPKPHYLTGPPAPCIVTGESPWGTGCSFFLILSPSLSFQSFKPLHERNWMASLWVHGTPENAAARFSTAMTVGFQPTPGAPVPPKNADDEVRVGPTSPSLRPRFQFRSRPARVASSQRRRSVNDGMRVDEL